MRNFTGIRNARFSLKQQEAKPVSKPFINKGDWIGSLSVISISRKWLSNQRSFTKFKTRRDAEILQCLKFLDWSDDFGLRGEWNTENATSLLVKRVPSEYEILRSDPNVSEAHNGLRRLLQYLMHFQWKIEWLRYRWVQMYTFSSRFSFSGLAVLQKSSLMRSLQGSTYSESNTSYESLKYHAWTGTGRNTNPE